jgi:hypothetical protein
MQPQSRAEGLEAPWRVAGMSLRGKAEEARVDVHSDGGSNRHTCSGRVELAHIGWPPSSSSFVSAWPPAR